MLQTAIYTSMISNVSLHLSAQSRKCFSILLSVPSNNFCASSTVSVATLCCTYMNEFISTLAEYRYLTVNNIDHFNINCLPGRDLHQ